MGSTELCCKAGGSSFHTPPRNSTQRSALLFLSNKGLLVMLHSETSIITENVLQNILKDQGSLKGSHSGFSKLHVLVRWPTRRLLVSKVRPPPSHGLHSRHTLWLSVFLVSICK